MADSKKPHFPAPPLLKMFSWKFRGLVLGLIDAKGIGVAQAVWHKLKNSLKNKKMYFLPVFGLMSDSLMTSWATLMPCAHQLILLTQGIGGAGKWVFFWVGHFIASSGIIYSCTMDGFFRILEKTSSELICTWLYVSARLMYVLTFSFTTVWIGRIQGSTISNSTC